MKKYFVSFTYSKYNSEGHIMATNQLTFEVIEFDVNKAPLLAKEFVISTLEKIGKGYKDINVLHMNQL